MATLKTRKSGDTRTSQQTLLTTTHGGKDFRVIINRNSSADYHMNEKVHIKLVLIANMKKVFINVYEVMVKKIIAAIIKPALEYSAVLWSPHFKKGY